MEKPENQLPEDLKRVLKNYVIWNCSLGFAEEHIKEHLKGKKIKNKDLKIKMLLNDLRGARRSFERWQLKNASEALGFIKRTIYFLN